MDPPDIVPATAMPDMNVPEDQARLAMGIETLVGRPQLPVVEKFLVSDHKS